MRISIKHSVKVALAIGATALGLSAAADDAGDRSAGAAGASAGIVSVASIDGTDVLADSEGRTLYTAAVERGAKILCGRPARRSGSPWSRRGTTRSRRPRSWTRTSASSTARRGPAAGVQRAAAVHVRRGGRRSAGGRRLRRRLPGHALRVGGGEGRRRLGITGLERPERRPRRRLWLLIRSGRRRPGSCGRRSRGGIGLMSATLSDEALLAGLASGEPDAAAAFVRRFQARVYGVVITIVRDPGTAEDVAQETFVRAWRNAGTYDPRRGRVVTWLLTIARNAAIDAMRVRRVEPLDPDVVAGRLQHAGAAGGFVTRAPAGRARSCPQRPRRATRGSAASAVPGGLSGANGARDQRPRGGAARDDQDAHPGGDAQVARFTGDRP